MGEPFVITSFDDFSLLSTDPSTGGEGSEILGSGGSDMEGPRLMFGVPGLECGLSIKTVSVMSPLVDLE